MLAEGIVGALFNYLQEFLALLELPNVNFKNDESILFRVTKVLVFLL